MITRALFQAAIEAGIERAGTRCVPPTDEQREALREVGRTATEFGTNFDCGPGCPAVLAGLYTPDSGIPAAFPTSAFASGFDRYLGRNAEQGYKLFNSEVVQVDG
jgi:hypothetical protein